MAILVVKLTYSVAKQCQPGPRVFCLFVFQTFSYHDPHITDLF